MTTAASRPSPLRRPAILLALAVPWLAAPPPRASGDPCCVALACLDRTPAACATQGGVAGFCHVGQPCGAPACNGPLILPVRLVKAARTGSDVRFAFAADPNADRYDVLYVTVGSSIPACSGCPGSTAVPGSAPTLIPEALHAGGVPGPGGAILFYEVAGRCGATVATGACCASLSCSVVSEAQCVAMGGNYGGDGVPCRMAGCPQGGACCRGTTCTFEAEPACTGSGGGYLGDGTTCGVTSCMVTGACCAGSACTVVTGAQCSSSGGSYLGDGVACFPTSPCVTGSGACCTGSACTVGTPAQCAAGGGAYVGDGTTCLGAPCPTSGACCTGTTCSVDSEPRCLAGGGAYLGDGTVCGPASCAVTGACCLGTTCTVTTGAQCGASGGTYQGDGVPCFPTDPC